MKEDRLDGLMILSSTSDILDSLDLDKIANSFSICKTKKIKILNDDSLKYFFSKLYNTLMFLIRFSAYQFYCISSCLRETHVQNIN